MPNTKKLPSQCSHAGCEKRPTYGLKGSKKREYCSQHAKKGMINVNSKRCIQPNCTTIPSFAMAGSKKAEFCSQHAMEGMIDVRSKRAGSQRAVSSKPAAAGSTKKSSSSSSSKRGAANGGAAASLGSKRCGRRGCNNRASSASGADGGNAEFCDQHATDGILVGGVLKGLGDYSRGGGNGKGKAAGGFDDQRYGGEGLGEGAAGAAAAAAGAKRKQPSLPPPPHSSLSSYPLATPEYLAMSDPIAGAAGGSRGNKRPAISSAPGPAAAAAIAALPVAAPLMQFRSPSSDRYTGGDTFHFRSLPSDRYLGGDPLGLPAPSLMPQPQQFRSQQAIDSGSRYGLGGGGGGVMDAQQFRPHSNERYHLGGGAAAAMPEGYPEDITSVFDKDVKL